MWYNTAVWIIASWASVKQIKNYTSRRHLQTTQMSAKYVTVAMATFSGVPVASICVNPRNGSTGPDKHQTMGQCWANAGPTSTTMGQP